MIPPNIPTAQRRWLLGELARWQQEGILSEEQAERIRGQYETESQTADRQSHGLVFALQALAALMFGLAALLLIGFNWSAMPREAKLATMLTVVLGTHAIGFYLRWRTEAKTLSEVVFFLGCLFYGAGIWLVAQAYHIEAHYPDGVWWWALGVLPFALCLDSLLCHVLLVVLLAVWAGIEVLGFIHMSPWFFFGWWHWPNGAYSLPLLALPGLIWAYRKASPFGVGLYVPLLAWWVLLLVIAFGASVYTVFWVAFLGAFLLVLAELHRPDDAMGIPFRFWGTLVTAGALVPLSSTYFWRFQAGPRVRLFDEKDHFLFQAGVTEILGLLVLLAIAVLIAMRVSSGRSLPPAQATRPWYPVTLAGGLVFLAIWSSVLPESPWGWGPPALLGNLAMIGLSLYLMRIGARDERVRPFAAGVFYFLVWAFARYVDLFHGAGGMLGAAALFALSAAGLIVVARFWGRARTAREDGSIPISVAIPHKGPAWVDRTATWLAARGPSVLIGGAALHLLVLVGMIGYAAVILMFGESIRLRVIPVDPRDFFRGDYVILSYDINRLAIDGDREEMKRKLGRDWIEYGTPIFVTLEPEEDGVHWRAGQMSLKRPTTGKVLQGKFTGNWRSPVEYGIEAYYLQEGTGLEWERLRNSRKLSAEISLAPWGRAKLRRLIAED